MTSNTHSQSMMDKEVEVPEWEHTHGSNNAAPTTPPAGPTLKQRFDNTMPPHKKYLGMKRNIFLLAILAAILALLALIIGLAVGLTQKSKYAIQPV
jgi:hypothetical protein